MKGPSHNGADMEISGNTRVNAAGAAR